MSIASFALLREALAECQEDGLRLVQGRLPSGRWGFWLAYPQDMDDHDRDVVERLLICSVWEVDMWLNEGVEPDKVGKLTISQLLALRQKARGAA